MSKWQAIIVPAYCQNPERALQLAAGDWHHRLALLWSCTRSAAHLTYARPLQSSSDHACMSALTAKIQAVHIKCQTSEADLTISVALPCRPINQQGLSGLLLHTRGCSPCSCFVWPGPDCQADYSKGSLAQDHRAVTRCMQSRLCHTVLHHHWHHLWRRQPKQSLVLHQNCPLLKVPAWIALLLCYRSVAKGWLFSALEKASKLSAQGVRLTDAELFIDCTGFNT